MHTNHVWSAEEAKGGRSEGLWRSYKQSAWCVWIILNIRSKHALERKNIWRCGTVHLKLQKCDRIWVCMPAKVLRKCCSTWVACVEYLEVSWCLMCVDMWYNIRRWWSCVQDIQTLRTLKYWRCPNDAEDLQRFVKLNKIMEDVCGVKVQEYSHKCRNMWNAKSMCIEPVRTHQRLTVTYVQTADLATEGPGKFTSDAWSQNPKIWAFLSAWIL